MIFDELDVYVELYKDAEYTENSEPISISRVFCQGCIAFGAEAGIRLEWGKHEADLVHLNGQHQWHLRRSLCGDAAAAAVNVGLIQCICTELI